MILILAFKKVLEYLVNWVSNLYLDRVIFTERGIFTDRGILLREESLLMEIQIYRYIDIKIYRYIDNR